MPTKLARLESTSTRTPAGRTPAGFAFAGLALAGLAVAGLALGCQALVGFGGAAGEQWPSWRGPRETGESSAVDLVSSWSVDGENLIWHQEWVGRSTPVVFDGRVCANARTGPGEIAAAKVACWDAGDGTRLWERTFNVYNTTVPFSRVGWASVVGDPETGYLYHHGVDGLIVALDRDGNTVWEWRLGEDTGRASGYGGRTQSPVIDGDQLILSNMGAFWGEHGAPRHRFFSFDKRSGDILWISLPGNRPWYDANAQGTPVVAEIDGRRLLIGGGADGWIYAMDASTGAPIWEFELSKAGINTTPVVIGTTVYFAHSEENVDGRTMGRVVAIDGTGRGNVTASNEIWRADGLGVGFSSPLYHEGVLYVVDNASNIVAINAESGEELWQIGAGTVGKSSPVWADGKIYYTEVNGRVFILRPGPEGAEIIDEEEITVEDGSRHAEIYGSPAIAYGRIYLSTEAGIFCIGDPSASFRTAAAPAVSPITPGIGAPAALQIVPAEVLADAGAEIDFELRAFDANGRPLGAQDGATWLVENLSGSIDGNGVFRAADGAGQAGKVIAELSGLSASARVRAYPPLPWEVSFESGSKPGWWTGGGLYRVEPMSGGMVLYKGPAATGLHRHVIYLGPDRMTGYTIEADLMGARQGRRRPDLGLINGGYTLDLQGVYQRLEVRAWASELDLRLGADERAAFAWQEDTWYRMKLRVDVEADHTLIRGKVWNRDNPEPEDWTITVTDPARIDHGAPGIYGYSPVDIYFDNLRVYANE